MTLEEYRKKEENRLSIVVAWLERGIDFVDINTAYIDKEVVIGEGTVIGPNGILQGKSVIGKNCKIMQNTRIENSKIADEASVESSVVLDSSIGEKTKVGPFAYIRPGSVIGKECKVGDFVEVKNSTFGDGSKTAHLTYIGDADVGRDVNIGCGVVFVNYDGTNKHRSTVEDGAFIGCNTNLVSPVTVNKGAYIAAGSTVTKEVPADALCVARAKQRNIEGWAAERGLYNK